MSRNIPRLRLSDWREYGHHWLAPLLGTEDIRRTKRLCLPREGYSVHMVTCHRNVDMALWCVKSLCFFAEESPSITIHDDGTLAAADKALLGAHLDRCRIIDKAVADERMAQVLAPFPLCQQMRTRADFYCALKLFDPAVFAVADTLLLLDSDVLFFQQPTELLACVRHQQPCFSSDYQDAYAAPSDALQHHLGNAVLPKVNMGIAVMRRADYDFAAMERYFSRFPSRSAM